MKLSPTAARALAAYGGEEVWKNAATAEGIVTVGGALFLLKGRRLPANALIRTDVRRAYTEIKPIDREGNVGILDGFTVTLASPDGTIIEQWLDARDHRQNQRIWTQWDRLNLLFFIGYAFWSYFALPHQLTRDDIKWTEIEDGALKADFGSHLPVHSRIQLFYFDRQTGLLKRNDYAAEAATPEARAANVVLRHEETSDGIPYPAKRRVMVTPRQYGWYLPAPAMVKIRVKEWRLSSRPTVRPRG